MIKIKNKNMLEFFGVTEDNVNEIRGNLFKQIHEIIFYGKGGYDYNTVYNMPIWLRKFTFNELRTFYDKENKANEDTVTASKNAMKSVGAVNKTKTPIAKQNIPSYVTKASK
jgi:hypothetical protein